MKFFRPNPLSTIIVHLIACHGHVRGPLAFPKVHCFEGPLFRRFDVPKVRCSEGSMFRRFIVPKVRYSEIKVHCSENKVQYSEKR